MNAIPLLFLGAGALLLSSGKKKRAGSAHTTRGAYESLARVAPGPSGANAGTKKWRERQNALVKTGYNPGEVDGKYGPNTKAAVKQFQADARIQIDGLWGPQTSAAMAEALKLAGQGKGKSAFAVIGKRILNSASNAAIGALQKAAAGAAGATAGASKWLERQKMLVKAGYSPGEVDGKYGAKTKAAVKAFQSDARIQVDGMWGPQTAAAMYPALKLVAKGVGKAGFSQIGEALVGNVVKSIMSGPAKSADKAQREAAKEVVDQAAEKILGAMKGKSCVGDVVLRANDPSLAAAQVSFLAKFGSGFYSPKELADYAVKALGCNIRGKNKVMVYDEKDQLVVSFNGIPEAYVNIIFGTARGLSSMGKINQEQYSAARMGATEWYQATTGKAPIDKVTNLIG